MECKQLAKSRGSRPYKSPQTESKPSKPDRGIHRGQRARRGLAESRVPEPPGVHQSQPSETASEAATDVGAFLSLQVRRPSLSLGSRAETSCGREIIPVRRRGRRFLCRCGLRKARAILELVFAAAAAARNPGFAPPAIRRLACSGDLSSQLSFRVFF
ncbi:hypothetical protein Taro_003996 [Colocasia esculenta]|uniref:Uncharacterized protein n=1 Tax=Colocasia esculenta TaxID=4460 RepID=A0A843TQG4_COLES|nr:hypothetical protein [Colocasia esculenta]